MAITTPAPVEQCGVEGCPQEKFTECPNCGLALCINHAIGHEC